MVDIYICRDKSTISCTSGAMYRYVPASEVISPDISSLAVSKFVSKICILSLARSKLPK